LWNHRTLEMYNHLQKVTRHLFRLAFQSIQNVGNPNGSIIPAITQNGCIYELSSEQI